MNEQLVCLICIIRFYREILSTTTLTYNCKVEKPFVDNVQKKFLVIRTVITIKILNNLNYTIEFQFNIHENPYMVKSEQ